MSTYFDRLAGGLFRYIGVAEFAIMSIVQLVTLGCDVAVRLSSRDIWMRRIGRCNFVSVLALGQQCIMSSGFFGFSPDHTLALSCHFRLACDLEAD